MFTEKLADFSQALLNGRKTFFGWPLKLGPRQHKVAQGQCVCSGLLWVQTGNGNGFVLGIQRFVRTKAGEEVGDAWQFGVVGCT